MYCLMFMYCLQLPKDMMGGRLVILAERQDKSIASVSGGVLQGDCPLWCACTDLLQRLQSYTVYIGPV